MQLSLWTIADNMATMEVQLQVERGLCQLRNARLLTDASEIKHFTLYLKQNERNTVLCMNGNDVMIVRSDDVDWVLNEILDVFDRFNEWEAEIDSLIASGGILEDVLCSAAQQLKMRLMMADATYYIHEFAACPGEPLPAEWEGLVFQKSMDLESTCDELVIHRSTLLYRLGRIEELTGIDFSDRDTWEHLVLSFMVRGKAR